ncbi:MAG: hypothetical protein KME50_23940 [Nostoc desertorum CM1-VF14]|nr:hypothetical protein [Nostoc desertorum CM1-VF14]
MQKLLASLIPVCSLRRARCFSQGETLRVACFPAGVQVGRAAQRTGFSGVRFPLIFHLFL